MTTCLIAFFTALLLAVACTRFVMYAACRLGVVDYPDGFRKIHTKAIPRLGGVGIYVAFFLPLFILYFFCRNFIAEQLFPLSRELLGLFVGSSIAFGMGCYDDVKSLLARWKLIFQVMAASAAFALGYAITEMNVPIIGHVELGFWSYPLTLFWFLGCMNALNLLDGLDGLAAGICLLVTVTILLVSLVFNNTVSMVLAACLSGAILGFLIFNFYPARIFLGDSGSMFLGFLIAAFSVLGSRTAETTVSILIPLIALGVPILDTSMAIVRRWSQKLPLSAPDRRHIHHQLLAMGLSHRRSVLILYSLCVFFGGCALLLTFDNSELTIMVLGSLAIIVFVCVRVLGGLRFGKVVNKVSDSLKYGVRDAKARAALERVIHNLPSAKDLPELWEKSQPFWETLQLDHVDIRIVAGGAEPKVMRWSVPGAGTSSEGKWQTCDHWKTQLSLCSDHGVPLGDLEIVRTIHDNPWLPVLPEVLDRFRVQLGLHIGRISQVDLEEDIVFKKEKEALTLGLAGESTV